MIAFVRPQLLLLALPWIGFWLWFARRQKRSCEWVWRHVHERFRARFTLYERRTLGRRVAVLLLLGLVLVVAAAGPAVRGETEVRELASRVVLLLDGSASMLADDVPIADGTETRFERGRGIAEELGRRLEGSRFALVVFSGVAALQLPMTADPATVEEALGAASFHTFYRSSGSSFTAALDSVLHFVEPERADLQAVLLSDGEQPFAASFDEPLAALEEAEVPVHTVAIGSREGQTRLIFDFRDVVAGKEEKTVLREYTTRREDRHLKRIARATGGRFTRADGRAAEEVAAAVERRIVGAETVHAEGWRDLTGLPLTIFLIGFLFEAMVWGRRGRRPPTTFDVGRLGAGRPVAAGMALLLAAGLATLACRDASPLGRANRENERGIAADALESWAQARVHYDRSRAFGLRSEIPAYNLARSVTLQEDWSEAHELYQKALELAPELAVAHYNDGYVLYRWGEAELDLETCELERTLELWQAAGRRFAGAAELYLAKSDGRTRARENLRFVGERMAFVEEACAPPPPPAGGASKGEEQSPDGGGEARGEGRAESQDDGEADGGEGEDEDEGEAGGEGEDEGEAGDGGSGTRPGEGDGDGAGGGGTGPAPLTGGELEEIRQALARIAEGRFADGRYHYRSLPEQFPREVWENPEAEIWW